MQKYILIALFFFCCFAEAREDVREFLIEDALSSHKADLKLGDEVAFYFGEQEYGEIKEDFGKVRTSKKTNAFNKSDYIACEWVFLSALIALKDRAIMQGATAIIEIKSSYKNNLVSSETTYQCGAGNVIAGVALTGKMVNLK